MVQLLVVCQSFYGGDTIKEGALFVSIYHKLCLSQICFEHFMWNSDPAGAKGIIGYPRALKKPWRGI